MNQQIGDVHEFFRESQSSCHSSPGTDKITLPFGKKKCCIHLFAHSDKFGTCATTVVSYQNESCLLALSLLHNSSREDGGKQGSSHLDEKKTF